MEKFFLNLKMERAWQPQYANHDDARRDITQYIVALQSGALALHAGLSVARRRRGETGSEKTQLPVRNKLTTMCTTKRLTGTSSQWDTQPGCVGNVR